MTIVMFRTQVFLCVASLVARVTFGIQPINTSLDTVPCGYFGGNFARRGDANIEMLAKMRVVMIEKWEGPCWQNCLADGTNSTSCSAACEVENYIIDTHRRVKAINPGVASVMYLNTMMDFPFYTLHGVFKSHGADVIDSSTKKPLVVQNDNGMENIFIWGFDNDEGVQLYIDAIKNLTSTGIIDGFFGDKWGVIAKLQKDGTWGICNKICGTVTESQAMAYNKGKAKALAAVTAIVGDGPYFMNGPPILNVSSNFGGHWGGTSTLHSGDPRDLVKDIIAGVATYSYYYVSSTGDQHWTTDPNDPASLVSHCDNQCLARFLLAVEKGAILGVNGWDVAYDKPLGKPMGSAVYTPAANGKPATLIRHFASQTYVVFTYHDNGSGGTGEIFWGGVAPPPPPPPTPPPPTPPPPTFVCGGYKSTMMNDTTFASFDVSHKLNITSVEECCIACGTNKDCVEWAWHYETDHSCHLHSKKATQKMKSGVSAGVMLRTA